MKLASMLSSINPSYPNDLLGLKACSAALGADSLLVQGGGGNTSIKIGTTLWVKASGAWLAQAESEDIFVPVDLATFPASGDAPRASASLSTTTLRPSIETSLHAVLPHKVIMHVHPVAVLAVAARADARDYLKDEPWHFITYVQPGWDLAHAVAGAWKKRPDVHVFILANHGLVVGGDTVDDAFHVLAQVVAACETTPRPVIACDAAATEKWLAAHPSMRLALHPVTSTLALDPISYGYSAEGVLYPDQAVFLGASLLENTEPRYAVVKDTGVFLAKDASRGAEDMLAGHAEILRRIPPATALNVLDRRQVEALLDWDAEHYRQGKVG